MRRSFLFLLLLRVAIPAAAATAVAPGIHLIAGVFVPGTQPDGNSVVIDAPAGLIVVDTGRHPAHTEAILAFARDEKKSIAAVINTHWHLDHIGGNLLLREAFPKVRIYATSAFADARSGFLASYRKQLDEAVAQSADDRSRDAYRAEAALIDAGDRLAPDDVLTSSTTRRIAGRKLEIRLTSHAVTAADIWIFDPATRTLVAGDLVTLPAPFLDTACPAGWKASLDRLAAVDFKILVPGHGAPMSRQQFQRYRTAFGNLLDCGAGAAAKSVCVEGWISDVGTLVAESDRQFTRSLMSYYVDLLRSDPAKFATLCGG